jgi:hypothetical protein
VIARQTTWAYVSKDAYVRDLNGKAWRVLSPVDVFGGSAKLIDAEGLVVDTPHIDPTRPVTVLEVSEAEALELLMRELGATLRFDSSCERCRAMSHVCPRCLIIIPHGEEVCDVCASPPTATVAQTFA